MRNVPQPEFTFPEVHADDGTWIAVIVLRDGEEMMHYNSLSVEPWSSRPNRYEPMSAEERIAFREWVIDRADKVWKRGKANVSV